MKLFSIYKCRSIADSLQTSKKAGRDEIPKSAIMLVSGRRETFFSGFCEELAFVQNFIKVYQ